MENNTAMKLENNTNMSEKEFILMQALIKERIERGEELEYEKFDGYELPPSTQFSMIKKPTVTIKYGKIRFNMAAIKLFSGIKYILPMLNGKKKRLAVVPCLEEENSTVEWARTRKKDDAWVNKDISSVDFVNKIFQNMGWKEDCRYKVIGRIANSDKGLILLFDLEEAIRFETKKKEIINPITGKKTIVNEKYYPEKYNDRIGIPYNEYVACGLNNGYENLEGYDDGSDDNSKLLNPPVDNIGLLNDSLVDNEKHSLNMASSDNHENDEIGVGNHISLNEDIASDEGLQVNSDNSRSNSIGITTDNASGITISNAEY